MPLQVMDVSKNEAGEKIKEKTKETPKGKNILDFFKTPEKEVSVKQKSLLQFFVQPNSVSTSNKTETKIEIEKEKSSENDKGKKVKNDKENLKKKGVELVVKNVKGEIKKQTCKKSGSKDKKPGDGNKESTAKKKATKEEIAIHDKESDSANLCFDEGNDDKTQVNNGDIITIDVEAVDNGDLVEKERKETSKESNSDNELELVPDDKIEDTINKKDVLPIVALNKDDTNLEDVSDDVPKQCKKNNLKVTDMLNLLKEVQDCERIKEEKKKKRKHKEHKHKSKDIGEDDRTEACDVIKIEDCEEIEPNQPKSNADQDQKKHDTCTLETKAVQDASEVTETSKTSSSKGKNNVKSVSKDDKTSEVADTGKPNEMSYNEFLAKLKDDDGEMEVDEMDTEITDNDPSGESNNDIPLTKVKSSKTDTGRTITNFFNFTSTPAKDMDLGTDSNNVMIKYEQELVNVKDKKNNFLKSKGSVPVKGTQATLSFGSDGFKMSKQKSIEQDSQKEEKPKLKGKGNVQSKLTRENKEEVDLDTSESVFMTPVAKKSKKRKLAEKFEQSTDLDESDLTDGPESEGRRRSLRKKYKVTVFQMDEERKTPIKIKLRRCAKSSSSGKDDLEKSIEKRLKKDKSKGNLKHSTALALLEKAKSRIHHKTKMRKKHDKEIKSINKTEEDCSNQTTKVSKRKEKKKKIPKKKEKSDSEPENNRRSSRLVGKMKVSMEDISIDNIVISSDEECSKAKVSKKKKKKGETCDAALTKEKSTPVKSAKGKSPTKKSGAKLAPMFLMGKKKSSVTESPVKPALDPKQAKERQAFLMSGVPDELKKQTAVRQANTMAYSYPPIPTINHIQQIPEMQSGTEWKGLNVWKLENVCLNLKCCDNALPVQPTSCIGDIVKMDHIKGGNGLMKLEKPKDMDEITVEKCLNEITSSNRSYPVREMYNMMKESKMYGQDGPNKTDTQQLRTDMKGILSEKEEPLPKKKSKRSLKLTKQDAELEIKEDIAVSSECVNTGGSTLLWTDKYYPAKASEILGNGASLKKMKEWLLEWKQVLDREAKKARKLLLKKNKGKMPSTKDKNDSDFDSDFDLDSDDSEDDSSLCNTTLLFGPHGCGKTSSVYALAQQLGFKVHEVNASSSRSGRQILSRLQEATQSHQVSSQGCHTPSKKKGIAEKPHDDTNQPKSKMALSFSNLINKVSDKVKTKESKASKADIDGKKTKKKKDKDDKVEKKTQLKDVKHKQMAALISEDSNSQTLTPSINLSSTTLILFEEIDVAFEEDRGFLSAVQTFMSTTKIPIILTSTKRNFSPSFDGRFEVISLKRPSVAAITSHLQTMALAENMRTDFVKLSELVKLKDRDVRQSILTLQLLVETGGTSDQVHSVLKDVPVASSVITKEETVETSSHVNVDKSDDDLDDFIVLKGRQNKRRRILDDQDSNSADVSSNLISDVPTVVGGSAEDESRKCPVVYGFGMKCFIPGLLQPCTQSSVNFIKGYLRGDSAQPVDNLIEICQTLKHLTSTHLFYGNLHLLLPLSFSVCDNVKQLSLSKECSNKKGKKRKRIQADLYDSEGSDVEVDDPAVSSQDDVKNCDERTQVSKTENTCVIKSLSSFASFYDTMATLDVISTCRDMKYQDKICSQGSIKSQIRLAAGLGDELCKFRYVSELDEETLCDIESCVETRAFCKLTKDIQQVKDVLENTDDISPERWDSFTLPVIRGMDEFQIKEIGSSSSTLELQRAVNDVKDSLPYIINKNPRPIHMDYIPTLRNICRVESNRLTTNTKRRFQHYLDNITLPLKDKTMNVLASSFT